MNIFGTITAYLNLLQAIGNWLLALLLQKDVCAKRVKHSLTEQVISAICQLLKTIRQSPVSSCQQHTLRPVTKFPQIYVLSKKYYHFYNHK